jgi:hypothetical protein
MSTYRKTRKVRVKAWSDDPITLQELSLGDIGEMSGKQFERVDFAMELVGRSLLDEEGRAVGANWLRENVGASKLPGLMELVDHCQDLNGFNKSEEQKKEEQENPLGRAPVKNAARSGARKNGGGVGEPVDAARVE